MSCGVFSCFFFLSRKFYKSVKLLTDENNWEFWSSDLVTPGGLVKGASGGEHGSQWKGL